MALKKSKTLRNGTTGEYWKITQISLDRTSRNVTYQVSLYLNKAARDSGCSPLDFKKTFSFTLTSEQANGDLSEIGYTKIKERASSMIPDPFSRVRPQPQIKCDLDLDGCEDV